MRTPALLLLASVFAGTIGCQPAADDTASTTTQTETSAASGGHVHAHDETGPHGGHLLHLEPSGVHAEWAHDDDTHTITVYLDDFDAEKIENVKFVATIGDTVEEFPLTAGDDGWSIESEALMTHINMGEAADVQFVVTDDSGNQSTKIEAHEHHHH